MDLPKLYNDFIIDKLEVHPLGAHTWAHMNAGDPDQFNLYQNNRYTLLLRAHILGVTEGPDAFEIYLSDGETLLLHEDVLEEDMNKESILAAIRTYNSGMGDQ